MLLLSSSLSPTLTYHLPTHIQMLKHLRTHMRARTHTRTVIHLHAFYVYAVWLLNTGIYTGPHFCVFVFFFFSFVFLFGQEGHLVG